MTPIATTTATWEAAIAAVQAAPEEEKDAAIATLIDLEAQLDGKPVHDFADAVLRLRIAHEMAVRAGEDDDPAWAMVRSALDILECAGESGN